MKQLRIKSLLLLFFLCSVAAMAQSRDTKLTIQVTSVEGDNLDGQKIVLKQTDFQVSYGTLILNENGTCEVKVYPGNHQLQIEREGFIPLSNEFVVEEGETEKTVSVSLTERTRQPFALKTSLSHNVFDGTNVVTLSWNKEEPAFSDDFENYTPFAINFGEWTGIDADQEVAAPLIGSYPNRGVMQYAQIINPLKVEPTWWYDYPILRPYDGQQYVGFTRTNSGNQNDDWLITPTISVGIDNVFSFMAKAADQFPERFMVYVTTVLDNPVQTDFVRLDKDNFETVDYRGWRKFDYDLSDYAGQQVKLAIRYINNYNLYRSFMLMVDNVYVGQDEQDSTYTTEKFRVFIDGELVATTTENSISLDNISAGSHTLGVQAYYIKAESDVTTCEIDVPSDVFAHVDFNFTSDSKLGVDGQKMSLVNIATTDTYEATVAEGKTIFASLPLGDYVVNVDEGAFNHVQETFTVHCDTTIQIELTDHILKPYNITATASDEGIYTLRWNQELLFSDSFEEYDDFATGQFGQWKSVDVDQQPVYPIALGTQTNIVSFPGSGTANNPTAIAPMVFNPWNTTPAMLPTDDAIKAPTGEKTVIFFSSQRVKSDKWLISPLIDINDNYLLQVKAKAYSPMYPESMEFCVSEGGDQPTDFTVVSTIDGIMAEQWTLYETDLSAYAGKTVRLAVHYTSYDAFLTQIDDFTVGPENGQGEIVDYGNVVRYEISVDGVLVGQSEKAEYVLPPLGEGVHTIGIKAVYKSGVSEEAMYTITISTGIATVKATMTPTAVYSLSGQLLGSKLNNVPAGFYIVKKGNKTIKIRK